MSRSIAEVLRELTGGQTYEELNSALTEVVAAVGETRKSGSITLKLSIKPNGDNSVIITDEIKSKVPERSRGETLFFTTSGGSLVRQDPRQPDLPLRSVPVPTHAAAGA